MTLFGLMKLIQLALFIYFRYRSSHTPKIAFAFFISSLLKIFQFKKFQPLYKFLCRFK